MKGNIAGLQSRKLGLLVVSDYKILLHNRRADRISKGIDRGAKTVKEPIDRQDEPNILQWEPHGVEHDNHRDQPGFGNPSGSDSGQGSCNSYYELLHEAQIHPDSLRYKDCGGSLVEGRTVHVNCGAQGNTNSVDRFETPAFSTAHCIATGSVAEELAVEKAVSKACDIWYMKR